MEGSKVIDYQEVWRQVEQEFSCDHTLTALTRYIASNKVVHFRRQCLRCGQLMATPKRETLPHADIEAAIPWNEKLKNEWHRKRAARHTEITQERKEAENAAFWEFHEEHLASEKWRLIRLRVMERCKSICEGCRINRATQVHHLTYAHLGDELLFELVALCRDCHNRVHGRDEAELVEAY